MMLEPSIDKLLDQVDSKYSLVVLEAKRAHELRDGERPTKEFKAVKRTLQALEEIADGTVKIHPAPELKRETLVEKRELERLQAKMKEQLIKEQIAKAGRRARDARGRRDHPDAQLFRNLADVRLGL